ncbi:MAG: sodium:solute symporter family protein [Ignavibacteriales bacterium]
MVNLNTIVLIVYFVLMFVIVGWGYKLTRSAEDYWIAGRSLGVIVSVGTFFATLVSSWSVLGAPGYFYDIGWAGYWQFGGTILTSVFAAVWFAAKIRETGCISLSDILAERYGSPSIRIISGVLILVGCVMFLTVQTLGAGVILNQITGVPQNAGVIMGVTIFLIWTITGGMHSVAWTDFAQALLIIGGLIAAVGIGLARIGGFGALHLRLAAEYPQYLDPFGGGKMGLVMILNWYFIWGVGNLGTPHFMTRFLACKDTKVARLSQGITALCFALFYFLIGILGALSKVFFPGIKSMETVGPTFLKGMLPPIAGAIIMSAFMAACMSTADSILLTAATTFVRDFYQMLGKRGVDDRKLVYISRLVTVVISMIAAAFALMKISTIFWLQPNMVATMGAALAPSLIAAFAWKRANKQGAIASILAGIIVTTLWFALKLQGTTGFHPSIPGTISSTVFLIWVSLATQAPPKEVLERFFPGAGGSAKGVNA